MGFDNEQLKEAHEFFKKAFSLMSEGIVVYDENKKCIFCSKSITEIQEASKKSLEIQDENDNIIKEDIVQYLINNAIKESKILTLKDGSGKKRYIKTTSQKMYSDTNKTLRYGVVLKDITDSNEKEIKLEEQHEFIKNVVDNVDVPIAVIKYPEYTFKLVNKCFKDGLESINGVALSYGDFIGKSIFKYIPSSLNEEEMKKDLIFEEGVERKNFHPIMIKFKNGEERALKFSVVKKESLKDGINLHVHGVDITEEIIHSEQMEKVYKMKDEFFTIISHELRTPLTIIHSSIQLLYKVYEKELTPNVGKGLSRIQQNTIRLLKLVNNVLDLSKAEAGFLKINNGVFDLVYVTESIVSSAQYYVENRGINLVFDTNEEEFLVKLDRDKYERIILNLLSNAIKFSHPDSEVWVILNIEEDKFKITVKDSGIGIEKDKLPNIFDRFALVNSSLNRSAEGTGLGLSLVKKLIELMEGTIDVESEINKGTTFTVTFNINEIDEEDMKLLNENKEFTSNRVNIEFSDVY